MIIEAGIMFAVYFGKKMVDKWKKTGGVEKEGGAAQPEQQTRQGKTGAKPAGQPGAPKQTKPKGGGLLVRRSHQHYVKVGKLSMLVSALRQFLLPGLGPVSLALF
ncbi:MAG: hypothetical protein GY940_39880, partial [bacterium]|nr:hypothetical protein [bacterium]